MTHKRALLWLDMMRDGALGPWRAWRVRRHLAACQGCATEGERRLGLRDALREGVAYHAAPAGLAARIGAGLAREAAAAPPFLVRRRPERRWFLLPGIGAAGALAGVALMLLLAGGAGSGRLDRSLVDAQVRSLMSDRLTDVLTSDRHTVKPWLAAHADVSPFVPELSGEGFPLIGGRVDYIDGHRAAVAVYRHDRHIINLFAWRKPGEGDEPVRKDSRGGFNIRRWAEGGIAYAAVSDVEAGQLGAFVADFRAAAGAGA